MGLFAAEFNGSYGKIAEGQSTAFYGQSSTKSRLWNVSINDLSDLSLVRTFQAALGRLPGSFSSANQHEFYAFFAKWGTHVYHVGDRRRQPGLLRHGEYQREPDEGERRGECDIRVQESARCLLGSASADWKSMGQAWLASRKASLVVTGGDPDVLDGFTPPSDFDQPVSFNDVYDQVDRPPSRDDPAWSPRVSGRSRTSRARPGATCFRTGPVHVPQRQRRSDRRDDDVVTANRSARSLCSMGVGVMSVPAPHPQVVPVQPMYWVVMADHDGTVVFNENVLSGDPDDLDKIVADATAFAGTGNYWTIAVSYGTVGVLSPVALQWFKSWGVSIPTKWPEYPGFPHFFTAVGQSNSSAYPAVVSAWSPGIDLR